MSNCFYKKRYNSYLKMEYFRKRSGIIAAYAGLTGKSAAGIEVNADRFRVPGMGWQSQGTVIEDPACGNSFRSTPAPCGLAFAKVLKGVVDSRRPNLLESAISV
jgi:hypothetical protein